MVVENHGLKVTHVTQLPRNLSQQFQDEEPVYPCSQCGQRFLIVSPMYLRQACLLQRGLWESRLSHLPPGKTYPKRRRVEEVTASPWKIKWGVLDSAELGRGIQEYRGWNTQTFTSFLSKLIFFNQFGPPGRGPKHLPPQQRSQTS